MKAIEKPKDTTSIAPSAQMPEIPLIEENIQKAESTIWANQVYSELCIQKKDNIHLKDKVVLLQRQTD